MKKIRITIIILFILFVAVVSGGSLLEKDRSFSPNENRYLAEPPEISFQNILEGKFQDGLEQYLKDQVCFRDKWITVKTGIQKVCGNTDIGGAYVGKDGYDFEKITREDVDERLVRRNIKAVSDYFDIASEFVPKDHLSFMLVPTSGYVMDDKLPENARLFEQSEYIDKVKNAMKDYHFVDVREELRSNKDQYIYYRTDHHWTMDGAYIAYKKWCEEEQLPYEDKNYLQQNVMTDRFRGSLYSKILDAGSAYDKIWTYSPAGDAPYGAHCKVTIDNKKTMDGCFVASKLKEKDKYMYFFGGNFGEVHITDQPDEESGDKSEKNLLVVKDSFANSFVPLITSDYDNIYMIDLRYYNGDAKEYLKEKEITDVLVLYNISNFISDKNIYKLVGRINY